MIKTSNQNTTTVEYHFIVPWVVDDKMMKNSKLGFPSAYWSNECSADIKYAGIMHGCNLYKFSGTEDELVAFLLKTDFTPCAAPPQFGEPYVG